MQKYLLSLILVFQIKHSLAVCTYKGNRSIEQFNGAPGDKCANWQVGESWNNGYIAHLVWTADHQVSGWTLNLEFDSPLDDLQCFAGDVSPSSDGVHWSVVPCEWDSDFQVGDTMDIPFQPMFAIGSSPDLVYADLDGPGHSICGTGPGPETTTSKSTPSTTSSSTTMPSTPTTTPAHTTQGLGGDCDDIFTIETEEEGAWNGLLAITAKSHIVGWEVHLTFDQPVDSIQSPLADVSGSRTEWKLHSKGFDEELLEGQTLELRFKTLYSGAKPFVTKVGFNGEILCNLATPTEEPTSSPGSDCTDIFSKESEEYNSWHGLLSLTVEEDLQGWEVILTFDQAVDSLETPLGDVSGSGTSWIIGSKDFDQSLPGGAVFELRFKVSFSGPVPDVVSVLWNEEAICQGETPSEDCSNAYSVESMGDGSVNILLPITPDQDVVGWEVLLNFDKSITGIESPLGDISGSGTDWKIRSKNFDENLPAGQTIELRFKVIYSGSPPGFVGIAFNGKSLCSGGGPGPTQPPTEPSQSSTSPTDAPYPTSHPGKYPYGEVLAQSLLFYEAERSGPLPSDNRVPWRGNSGLGDAVLGGYYDAGDHVKFGFPMAAMTTILSWGGLSFYEGYEKGGQLEWMDKCIKWSTDYFMKAHKSDNELVGQIGDGDVDHAWWGRPEEMTMNRPSWSITSSAPGSDLAGETAAALAAASLYFHRRGDSGYADNLLTHARSLFDFADQHRGVYTDAIPNAQNFYASWSGYEDELVWAAVWLAKATGEQEYLNKAEGFYNQFPENQGRPGEFSWDDKTAGAQLLLFELTQDEKYRSNVQAFLDFLWTCDTTPKGLIWLDSSQWGSLRYAGDLAHFTLQAAHNGIDVDNSVNFAESQINYILGDTGRSYVCGWGQNPPVKPHHRGSSCPSSGVCDWNSGYNNPGPNPQVLNGALVGGPDHNDNYVDDRTNFQTNEVATDYNAGFQSALAGLNKIYG